jgi:predicted RNase H-like HicB family nuclease
MLTEYIDAAMKHAKIEYLDEDGIYYAEIPELPGVWAEADDEKDLYAELREALEGWITLSLKMNHPVPVIDGVGLAFELA